MAYNRKGGSGFGSSRYKTIEQTFNYYKKQLDRRIISEQAFHYARTGELVGSKRLMMFNQENLNYEKVFKEGITRKEGAYTVRYTGIEAVQIQIQSMKERASKSYMRNSYIENYLDAMYEVGFDSEDIKQVQSKLEKLSTDQLTYLIDSGLIKEIEFLYTTSAKTQLEDILNSLTLSGEEKSKIRDITRKGIEARETIAKLL